jgi:hypothetical protein
MFARGQQHFYVNEIAQLFSGAYFIPNRWVMRAQQLCGDGHSLLLSPSGEGYSISPISTSVPADDFQYTFPELQTLHCVPRLEHPFQSWLDRMPHPLREAADGLELYTIFVDVWGDDVSGNRSKSYNKHFNIYFTNRSLPRKLNQHEYHVHFVSTSQHASVVEQMGAVTELIQCV